MKSEELGYAEAIDFLFNALPVWERSGAGAYKPGLERITAFMSTLGLDGIYSPRNDADGMRPVPTIHVAGTNGKGSVCHLLAAVLQSAGHRTGLFTSPHLVDFRERIRVDGEMIPREAVVEFTERWKDEMVRGGLTFFEMATAMGLWWFRRAGCDVAVIETGLGGRLDSTNIVTPLVSVVTNIGLEHTQYLGDTIAAIAAEKAGIIKPGVPVVVGETDSESAPVFRAKAAETASEIVFADKSNYELRITNYDIDLAGDYQQKNLATVLATVEVVRRTLPVSDEALRKGLAHAAAVTGMRGRWQVVRRGPLVVLDTAHNAHGIAAAMRQIARQKYDKLYMVLGFAGDKDLGAIIPLLPPDAHYILTAADTPRAMPAEELARRVNYELRITNYEHSEYSSTEHRTSAARPGEVSREGGNYERSEVITDGGKVESELTQNLDCAAARRVASLSTFNFQLSTLETAEGVEGAVERALSLAGPGDMVFVGGSNFVVGEALRALDC